MIHHFGKIGCPIGNALGKETVLSKAINNIDVFKIKLASAYDDSKTKYVQMISKLDSGKSVMLELKGPEVRVKNLNSIKIKKGETVEVLYGDFFEDTQTQLLIDYSMMADVTKNAKLVIDGQEILKVKENQDGKLITECLVTKEIASDTLITFADYTAVIEFLTPRDQRDLTRATQNNLNMIVVPYVKSVDDIMSIRSYLNKNKGEHVKLIMKVQMEEVVNQLEDFLPHIDAFLVYETDMVELVGEKKGFDLIDNLIDISNMDGKPVLVGVNCKRLTSKKIIDESVKHYIEKGVSCFMFSDDIVQMDEPTDFIINFYDSVLANQIIERPPVPFEKAKIHADYVIHDYIIYNAYRTLQEIGIKAIICYTENGYTAARLASYKPNIPVIAFTKNDYAYRYLNLLWSVKGYKIAPGFDYNNIKQIGKEIIRILFKGNITLEDRILVLHASSATPDTANIINGIEVYKFKDI
ncbi:MAG: pyruvate kinase [Candidatus Absconditabacterales bacterium]